MSGTIPFDDLDAFAAAAERGFGEWSQPYGVTQEVVDAFAHLSDDHQWIHTDPDRAARESPFGGTIAHGFLLLALLPRIRTAALDVTGHSSAVNYGAEGLRFLAPVLVGSAIRSRSRVLTARAKPAGTLVTTELDVSVVDAPKPALLYQMQILYRR